MNRFARPESSKDAPGRSSLGLNNDEWVDMARNGLSQSVSRSGSLSPDTARFLPGGGTIRRNRLRMVGETTMNRRNGSTPSPPNGVAKDMGELANDIVSLAELQFELLRIDCREGLKRMLVPVAMLLVAGIVAVGTVPIALIFIAEFLTQAAGLSRAAAFSIVA